MEKLNFIGVSVISFIAGCFAVSAYSVVGTEYEPLFALWFVFAGLASVSAVCFLLYASFEEEYTGETNRIIASILSVTSAAIPCLLWAYEIIVFN